MFHLIVDLVAGARFIHLECHREFCLFYGFIMDKGGYFFAPQDISSKTLLKEIKGPYSSALELLEAVEELRAETLKDIKI